MNYSHLPRPLVIVLFIMVAVSFFVGTLRAFIPAHALSNATVSPAASLALKTPTTTPPTTLTATPAEPENDGLGPTPAVTNTGQAGSEEGSISTPTPAPIDKTVYADTTGIIALAILMVVVILVGMAWGGRRPRKKKEPTK